MNVSTGSSFFELCGRKPEFETLRSWFQEATESAPALMLVSGVAGIGKTHLCSAFLADIAPEAVTLVGLTSRNQDADNPFVGLTEALLDAAAERAIPVAATLLNDLGALRPGSVTDAPSEPTRTLDASRFADRPHHRGFVELTQLIARQSPLVLLVDDLQWVSPPAIHLLRHIINNPQPYPVKLLATCRPNPSDAVDSYLSELELLGLSEQIELEGLTEAEVGELLTSRGAETTDLTANAAKLMSLTRGNPLLITTALGAAAPGQPLPAQSMGLSTLGETFASFDPSTQRVLAQLGVFGRSQPLALMADALRIDDVSSKLEPAAEAGWVEFHPNTQAASFTHDEFRDTALRAQDPDELIAFHRAAARVLVGDAHNESGLVFHLIEAKADPAEVKALALMAARKSMKRQAYEEAAQLFALAMPEVLAVASSVAETESGSDLDIVDDLDHADLLDLAECLRRTNHPSAPHTIALAFESARRHDDVDGLVRSVLFQTRIGEFSALGAVDDKVVESLQFVLARIDPQKQSGDAALVLSALVEELLFGPIAQNRDAMSQRAIDLADESGDDQAIFVARLARRNTFCQPDQLDLRIKAGQSLAQLASRANNEWGLALAHLLLAGNLLERGDRAGCETRLELSDVANATLQSPTLAYAISCRRTALLVMDGEFEAAQAAVLSDLRLGEVAGMDPAYTFGVYGSQMLLMNCSLGTTSELVDAFKMGMETRPEFTAFGAACAVALAEAGDPEAAELVDRLSADGFESVRFDYFWILTIGMIGRAAMVIDNQAVCQLAFDRLKPFSGLLVWSGVSSSGPVDWYLGAFAATLGRTEEGAQYLGQAAQQADRLGMVPIAAHIADDLATVLAAKPATPVPGASFRFRPWPRS